MIRPAADHVAGQAGNLERFPSRSVEVHRLRDGGDLAEEPQVVQVSLARRVAGRQVGGMGPGDGGDDPANEFLDAQRGGFRLGALDADQRRLLLLIGEIALNRAADDQHAADEAEEHDNVFSEQAVPYTHGITWAEPNDK
jgi:hypothetical protein